MWPFKRSGRCKDCGFMYENERCFVNYEANRLSITIKKIGTALEAKSKTRTVYELIKCPMYIKKIPGLTHEQHLEHKLYKGPGVNISRWALVVSIIAIFISAGALIVSMLIR